MKIRKTPSKKLAPLPQPVRDLIERLEQGPEQEIGSGIAVLTNWHYPRGDLFHWTQVLNRFDTILERICDEYKLQHTQARDFEKDTKKVLLDIINLSRLLFENCTNRNIYNSYEHMNALLNTVDIDVLEAVLRFTVRPAQRINNPRAIRSSYVAPQDKITELARGWGFQQNLVELYNQRLDVTEDMTTLKLRFYRTDSDQSEKQKQPTSQDAEGVQVISAQMANATQSDVQIFQDLVQQHKVPQDYQFELANRLRIAKHIAHPHTRRKLLHIRILAIAVMSHTVSETTAQNKVFIYEPHLVAHLAELLHAENGIHYDMQAYALSALDGIAKHRGKLSEVLTALNASANHGVLLQILRKINQETSREYPKEFLDALFTLLACLLQNQPGGQMLMSAGIIPTLVNILGNQQCIQTKYVSKIISLLDTIINAFTSSFHNFCTAGGLDTLLARIKSEVNAGLEQADESMDESEAAASGTLAPYDRCSAIKSMLKFLLRMMESSGTADGLRNLIESSIPHSLLKIVAKPRVFGPSVFTLSVNVMTTFIHNEPTSLAILQEAKLPQTFLESICAYKQSNSETLLAAVNAFGAICLNGPGIEMFNEHKPLPHFFELMTDPEFLRTATEVDSATPLGGSIDELIRHHPSLRPAVFECVADMIRKVIKIGNDVSGKPSDDSHRLQLMKARDEESTDVEMTTTESPSGGSKKSSEDPKKEEKTDCLLVSFIDMVARFLEGLFQNQSNIREFVKGDLPDVLLDYYTLPLLPADFSVTIASDSLAYVLKMISEVSTVPTIMAIAEKAKSSMRFFVDNDSARTESMVKDYIDIKENEDAKINSGNDTFRKLIIMHGYVGLLSNLCCSSGLAPGKNGASLVAEFISEDAQENMILLLGKLYRTALWENFLLKEFLPPAWYAFKPPKKNPGNAADHPLGIFGVDQAATSPAEGTSGGASAPAPASDASGAAAAAAAAAPESVSPAPESKKEEAEKEEDKTPDANDPRMQNIKHFKLLFGDIPQFLMPMFQGLIKVSMSRRVMDTAQKAQAFKLSGYMTQLFKENFTWPCVTRSDAPPSKYDYIATTYTMVSLLLLDDRSQAHLHTPLAVTFHRQGGTDLLLQSFADTWAAAAKIGNKSKEERSSQEEDILPRMQANLEMLLTILVYLGSSKLLQDSPYTAPIVNKDRNSPDFFDPYEWIIAMKLKLSTLVEYVKSPEISETAKPVIHVMFEIIMEILKGEGETLMRADPLITTPLASPFTLLRAPVTADERGVQHLVDMGFDRHASEQAMIRCNNQISRAVDYLFTHPTPVLTGAGNRPSGDQAQQGNTQESNDTSGDEEAAQRETAERDDHGSEDEDSDAEESYADVDENPDTPARPDASAAATAATTSTSQPSSSSAEKPDAADTDKPKSDISGDVQKLKDIRESIKASLPPMLLELVDKREDAIFDVRDLLVAFCKGDNDSTYAKVILSLLIERIKAASHDLGSKSPLSTRLRLLALLSKEPTMESATASLTPRLSFLFGMVSDLAKRKPPAADAEEEPLPPWTTTVFLVLEAFISEADEPRKVKLQKFHDDNSDRMSEDDENEENDEGPSVDDIEPSAIVSDDQRAELLDNCVVFLKRTNLSRDNAYAILRILVRLTKYNGAAVQFVEKGGLPLLFTKPRSTFEDLQGQQAFIILILRHIIEDEAVLRNSIEEMITTWFTIPRPRNMDIATFLRNNAPVALREPRIFLEVANRIVRLTHYDEYDVNHQVKLLAKDEPSEVDPKKKETQAADEDSEMKPAESLSLDNGADQHNLKGSNSPHVINHLLNELLSVQHTEVKEKRSHDDKPEATEEEKKAENIRYAYTGFILQCLVELVSSYKSCKYDVYTFCRRRNSKDGNSKGSRNSTILNLLINELLPCNAINPTAEESRKQQGLSMWTASVLVAMCYDSGSDSEAYETNPKHDLTQVRKYVFDGLIRSLKDATASTVPLSTKYGKFLALSDLCHRILNARPNTAMQAQRPKDDTATSIAKIMLDKNFVGVLTTAISDVDINYPHAKTVLNAMLRPLEQLTKIAIRISEENSKEDDKKREEYSAYVPAGRGDGEEEAPDLYRNSALGMFDGSAIEDDDMDEYDSDEEDEETFDEEDFDEDTGSDLSDMSEGDDAGEDMDDDMIMHQYDTEMDEDEDESGDEDGSHHHTDDDDDLDHDDDEDDLEEEEGREMTWQLEDIENDPVIQVEAEVDVDTTPNTPHDYDPFDEGHDDELDTADQSDFDEDEESDNLDEGDPADLNDGILLDEDDADNPFLTQDLQSDGLLFEDEPRPRGSSSFNLRRYHRPVHSRRIPGESGAGNAPGQDDIITHPLLAENRPGNAGESHSRHLRDMTAAARPRSNGLSSWQAFEDIIGGSAFRLLESFLSQAPPSTQAGPMRVDVQGRTGGILRSFEFDHIPPIGQRGQARTGEGQAIDQNRELMAVLHDFQPMTSADRWHQEARMMYGNSLTDKALKLSNALLNALIPIAIEDEKKRRAEEENRRQEQRRIEEEERKKAEEERWKREEEERKRKEEEERRAAEEREAQAARAAQEGSNADVTLAQVEGANAGENQNERSTITINGEDIDISGTGIDIEFLEALPEDLREEVVSQHVREHRTATETTTDEAISPEFLDALPPEIRAEVIHQEAIERNRLSRRRQGALPTPGATRETGLGDDALPRFSARPSPLAAAAASAASGAGSSSQRKTGVHRSAMQLVDRAQLATLARLLFVPQSVQKSVLNRLLINLCENNKTRSDLLSFLICVLHDGSGDLAAVDRSFAQLSLQSKEAPKSASKSKAPMASMMSLSPGENVPNLITQRCLEFLMHVVQWNDQSLTYFLTENDCLAELKRSSLRKSKGKEKSTPSSKYPLLVLMSLLDRPVFIENPSLMEELMHLISTICRPFPVLIKKYVEKVERKQQQQKAEEEQAATGEQGEGAENKQQQQQQQQQKELDRPLPKPPTIPDHYLKLVVHVLTTGECSSKTFQYTLSALSHLSALNGAQRTITNELVEDAKESSQQIQRDLQSLLQVLENAMPGTEIQGSALSNFSAASSHQAKLLRVLKTIDYMYSRKPTVAATSADSDKPSDEEATKDEKRVLEIYEELNFLPLWKMLGQCLSVIHEKEDYINVATVLLPLIEAFMVMSKYAAEKGQTTRGGAYVPPASPTKEQPTTIVNTSEDFFFAFTEEHKKILNIMVRNNPSLMSGSFSLLVRNPKMLEFDNKRNYFVQQLHKRTGPREHYAPLQLNVRRQYVFEDSYHQLLGRTGDEIKFGKLSVRFYDEEGVDAGGVAREWFSVLARQMFDPNYALFITSAADKLTYQPNRASYVNPDHLSYFKFVGRVIGKAIYDGRLLDAYFTRSFYKHILGRQVDYRDVEAIDPEYYKSLVWMLENDITDIIDLTFSLETDDFGTTEVIDLKPNGRDIPVTEENKHEYVALVTEQKLTTAIKDQINAFLQGFHDVIQAPLIQIFNEQELELLISGMPDIDIDDWKNNTEYQGYTPASPQIQWFWRAVRSFDQEERAKLLQFATGTSKVPLEGFTQLQGSGGVQKFQIHKDFGGENRLPSAHTCFNQVDLPMYDTYESLRSNLFKAINECSTGFGFV
ncbi:hypothetical protein BCR43DRAFT_557706 [Syncephalastrum racemosum]|uniref:HECT-type E3 ubiquitin transferase n=1 Tax=Syncephalastrum racemosum TaxID=13706 RepID=A0A1X2HAX2_SYNRA|nr:hypothetical protein BCR43DRAFT_557706 [Syncephalastrum racemosum]